MKWTKGEESTRFPHVPERGPGSRLPTERRRHMARTSITAGQAASAPTPASARAAQRRAEKRAAEARARELLSGLLGAADFAHVQRLGYLELLSPGTYFDRDHVWHMDELARLADGPGADPIFLA